MRIPPGLPVAFCTCSLLIVIGCADPSGKVGVSGTVSYKGAVVEQGSIQFLAADGKNSFGTSIENGRYAIPSKQGLNPGSYKIVISSLEGAGVPKDPGGIPGPPPKERIPAKYNSKSELTREIKSGQTTQDFNLD
jgi:hypothetical protein